MRNTSATAAIALAVIATKSSLKTPSLTHASLEMLLEIKGYFTEFLCWI